MIQLVRITNSNHAHMERLITLYTEAFPPLEQRSLSQLKYLIENESRLFFNAIEENNQLCGFISFWRFGAFYYIEHFAVNPEMRNRKIGQQVLDYLKNQQIRPIILEVDPLCDEITKRRIAYYERNGFEVLDKNYIQPAYSGNPNENLSLWIMGNASIKQTDLEKYIQTIKEKVYFSTSHS